MSKSSKYASKFPDQAGLFSYSAEEDRVWSELFESQCKFLENRMCDEYFDGIDTLEMPSTRVPQIKDIDRAMEEALNFGVEGVPAIIPPSQFFDLLARRKFPVATFIRTREDMQYIEEPDIFHEVFGHCPMLTNPDFANFVEKFGKLAVDLGKSYSWRLFRLFWFTVEFGMIKTPDGLRGYGAGIASSPSEAEFATGGTAEILDFDLMTILRTPYRIDIVQPVYFAIENFAQLSASLDQDIAALIDKAKEMGDLPARFEKAA